MKRALAALALAACSSLPPPPPVEPRPGLEVRIVRHDELVTRTATRAPIELPFGQSQDGTALVTTLLQRARAAGATYVGDLAFHMVFKWRGSFVECETTLSFGNSPVVPPPAAAPVAAPEDVYSTEIRSFEPKQLALVADETALKCKQVAVVREEEQRRYDSRFDAQVARKSNEIPVDTVMTSEQVEQCSPERMKRHVERYDYQVRLDYVPPDWTYLAATYAGEQLSESPPLCYALDADAIGAHPVHRLTATLGFRGIIEQAEPLKAPSANPASRAGHRRVTLSH